MGVPVGKLLKQAGVIPYRVVEGRVEVLLVTSRDTGRWVIPKGNIDNGMTSGQAALQEAWEEAGVSGNLASKMPLGFVPYFKALKEGASCAATIEVFAMLVLREETKWQERSQRKRVWFTPKDAASKVDEPALAALLLRIEDIYGEEAGWLYSLSANL
jgi:predicted NUDIX family NTP pyrophosphohydrolase